MGSTQKIIGWIILGIGALLFIVALSLPDLEATADEGEWGDGIIICNDGEAVYGEIEDGWKDCDDGSDESETTGADMGAFSCCCMIIPGFLTLVTNYNTKNKQMMIMQNPAQMQMQMQAQQQQMQMNVLNHKMQMQAQQQQMHAQRQQMHAQRQQMHAQRQQMQVRQNIGSAVQQVGAKISGNNQNNDKFKEILSMVLADGYMSKKEEEKIEKKRVDLGISVDEHRAILKELGLDWDQLKKLQKAKTNEDAGRLDIAAQMYEDAGKLDKASALRFQLKAMEKSGGGVHTTTYNISDSAIGGGINDGKE